MANDFGISLDDAVNELSWAVEEAYNFMVSEFSQDWDIGEAYFAGKCDLETEKGRSTIVKTEARDVIRALMPNVMRILLQAKKPVEYIPCSVRDAAYISRQGLWINHLFNAAGGYKSLYDATLESMKLKSGPIKVVWEENPAPEHIYVTGITAEEVLAYKEVEDIVIEEVSEHESPTGGEQLFDLRGTRYYTNGKISFEAFPIYEFFVRRNASSLDGLHGHRRSVTVGEAIELGLEYDNWRDLDNNDPKTNDAASPETLRRGYTPDESDEKTVDLMQHKFLLTEAYCYFDMDGDGVPEKYVFYLGGSKYEYLHHEQIEDFCIALVSVDPMPFTVIGRSIVDLTKQSQDNETSILRAIVDNAHQANNPRPAADPNRVNFNDLMNNSIGAPIRTKGKAEIQYVDIPFTAQGLMPFLEWLERDAEMRVGVTKAARGLDPDALQSTDKNAVMNTISLSQGQVELIVRNIVETGMIPLFRMALRLAMRHMDSRQMMIYKDAVVPVDISRFDPNLTAIPRVGIGTTSPEQKFGTLQFILQQQKEYMQTFGVDNPFTSLSQIYNTLEDMLEIGGIYDPGRYFTYIGRTEEQIIGQQLMQQRAMQAQSQRENQPLDPGKALFMTESLKARTNQLKIMTDRAVKHAELQKDALQFSEEMDFRRDDMAQQRVIDLAKIGQGALDAKIKREQDASKPKSTEGSATRNQSTG